MAHEVTGALSPPAAPMRMRDSGRWLYLGMAILVAVVVVSGFSRTIGGNLLHPKVPRPRILWVHAAVFFSWVLLFTAQAALVRTRRVRWHRRLGIAGLALGSTVVILGVATVLVMARFDIAQEPSRRVQVLAFLAIPFNDLLCFATTFAAAAWLRKRPEHHRRLMLIATCCLTSAAFGRLPFVPLPALRVYGGVDLLLAIAVAIDWLATRRVHTVYRIALPPIVLGQAIAMTLFFARPPFWIALAQRVVG